MFTTVNSKRKKVKQNLKQDEHTLLSLDNSILPTNKFAIAKRLVNFFEVSDDYSKLQLTVFCLTLIFSIITTIVTSLFVSSTFGLSIFIGSIAGIFYLRLLAKSIGNLGKTSSGISKVQLLLPVCLFIFASKNDLIEILPAMMGFFSYKPAMFFYFSRS